MLRLFKGFASSFLNPTHLPSLYSNSLKSLPHLSSVELLQYTLPNQLGTPLPKIVKNKNDAAEQKKKVSLVHTVNSQERRKPMTQMYWVNEEDCFY